MGDVEQERQKYYLNCWISLLVSLTIELALEKFSVCWAARIISNSMAVYF